MQRMQYAELPERKPDSEISSTRTPVASSQLLRQSPTEAALKDSYGWQPSYCPNVITPNRPLA